MDLEECFRPKPDWSAKMPKDGDLGTETDWMRFTELRVDSGMVLFLDPLAADNPEHGLMVELSAGKHEVWVKAMMYGRMGVPSRLRVILPGTNPVLGGEIGTTWTDVATTGVCDYEAFAKASQNPDKYDNEIRQKVFDIDVYIVVPLDPESEATVAAVTSGFGDGEYRVFELLSESKRVGAEVEFIPPDGPFGEVPRIQSSEDFYESLGIDLDSP